jgi:hypothetical protein
MRSALVQIAAGFVNFAGSEENAAALVDAMHDGKPVELSYPTPDDPETPVQLKIEIPAIPMAANGVRMALMLARDALVNIGISRPTGEQLRAVLMGGELTTPSGRRVQMRGVLTMRSEGFNWGRIASERFQRPLVIRLD